MLISDHILKIENVVLNTFENRYGIAVQFALCF